MFFICYHLSYTPSSLRFVYGGNNQILPDMPKEVSVFSVKDNYQEVDFNVVHRAAGNFRYPGTD